MHFLTMRHRPFVPCRLRAQCTVPQDKYVKSSEIQSVADRIGSDYATDGARKAVCQAFRDLIASCSDSTFMVRAASFPPTELAALEKSQAASVRHFVYYALPTRVYYNASNDPF